MVLFFKVKISWLFGFKDSFNRENEESIYFQSNLFNAFFTALKKMWIEYSASIQVYFFKKYFSD